MLVLGMLSILEHFIEYYIFCLSFKAVIYYQRLDLTLELARFEPEVCMQSYQMRKNQNNLSELVKVKLRGYYKVTGKTIVIIILLHIIVKIYF